MNGPTTPCVACNKATPLGSNTVTFYGELGDLCAICSSPHHLDNHGVALDAVGCTCGWSAKATSKQAKRAALLAHQQTIGGVA